jgi:hypothetical protein
VSITEPDPTQSASDHVGPSCKVHLQKNNMSAFLQVCSFSFPTLFLPPLFARIHPSEVRDPTTADKAGHAQQLNPSDSVFQLLWSLLSWEAKSLDSSQAYGKTRFPYG